MNNFWWNRHWTFGAGGGPRRLPGGALLRRQRGRVLVRARDPRAAGDRRRRADASAQAISIVAATPAQLHREQDVELRDRAVAATERRSLAALCAARCCVAGARARRPPTSRARRPRPSRRGLRAQRPTGDAASPTASPKVRRAAQARAAAAALRVHEAASARWQVSYFRRRQGAGAGARSTTPPARCSSSGPGRPGGVDDGARLPGRVRPASSTRRTSGCRCACCSSRRSSTCRRPFRLLHLDLLVLLAFGVSHFFFNRGEIGDVGAARVPGAAVPAGARAARGGFRPRARGRARWCRTRRLTLAGARRCVFLVGVPDRAERGRLERDRRRLRGRDRRRPDHRRRPALRRAASRRTTSTATPTGR